MTSGGGRLAIGGRVVIGGRLAIGGRVVACGRLWTVEGARRVAGLRVSFEQNQTVLGKFVIVVKENPPGSGMR